MFSSIRNAIRARWQDLLDGFWFIPSLVALIGPLLAVVLLWVDSSIKISGALFTFGGSSAEARTLLSTVVSSLITVAGVVLSITIVTLQLVSSQFTPRALRSLLSDRITQATFGGFLGIFVYCMIILVSLRDPAEGNGGGFLPRLGVEVAIVMTFLAVILLVIFISHTASAIQISHIASRVAHQTLAAVDHPYPFSTAKFTSDDGEELVRTWSKEAEPVRIYAPDVGYVQTVDLHHFANIVTCDHLRLHLKVCPGDFVTQGTALVEVWMPGVMKQECITAIQELVALARERDLEQDPAFGVRQLADICLRALSPAINDPTTAVLCIGYLRSLLERIASYPRPAGVHRFSADSVMVIRYHTFSEYMNVFLEIARYASNNARVVAALLDALASIADNTISSARQERLPLLAAIASSVADLALQKDHAQLDRSIVVGRLKHIERITQVAQTA